jgi:hypothetical protein
MRTKLEDEVGLFWRCATAIREHARGVLIVADNYGDELEVLADFTDNEKVHNRCADMLMEFRGVELLRTA